MPMKIIDYIKQMGRIKISEICNWDLADIRNRLIRVTNIRDGQISRVMKKFQDLHLVK